jgi:hypothetical protein
MKSVKHQFNSDRSVTDESEAASPTRHASTRSLSREKSPTRPNHLMQATHVYEVRPRKDHCGVNLISDALPFGRVWYGEPHAVTTVEYAKFFSRLHDAVIRRPASFKYYILVS